MDILLTLLTAISLAACAGLRAFLPLFALGAAVRWGGFHVQSSLAWVGSDAALFTFGLASLLEMLADKVPGLDHVLDVFHTFARPVAGALVAMGAAADLPPTYAMALGIILGAPLAGGFHLSRAGARVGSSALSLGFANPILSAVEDALAIGGVVLAFLVPVLAVLLLGAAAVVGFALIRRWRSRRAGA